MILLIVPTDLHSRTKAFDFVFNHKFLSIRSFFPLIYINFGSKKDMIVYPNAKINIGLNIVSKRTDGYHNLETVFYPIDLTDTLSVEKTSDTKTILITNGIKIEGNSEDNLVMKAYRLLEKDFKIPAVSMSLTKNIPSQAGLGGGSSDAAFTLKALNELFDLQLTDEQLETYASLLGADCPFFIKNKAVFAEGTGNIFTPLDLSLKKYYLLLVKPEVYISTKEAFQHVKPHAPEKQLTSLLQMSPDKWKDNVKNDFEESVFPIHKSLPMIKKKLYDAGAVYASMSGSGSSLYGLFTRPLKKAEDMFPHCFCRQIVLK